MKNIFSTAVLAFSFLGAGVILSSTGCRKKKDTIAKVYVKDTSNDPVASATVRLYGQSTEPNSGAVILDVSSTSNSAGEAIFDFNDVYQLGQAGVAVLNIDAESGPLSGSGIIKVEQETTSEETVFVQ